MESDKRARRVKATGAATHRKGKLRAAVKPSAQQQAQASAQTQNNEQAQVPHSAQSTAKDSIQQFINAFMDQLGSGHVSQSVWGDRLAGSEQSLRSYFRLEQSETPYLLVSLGRASQGDAGLLICTPGIRINDGNGTVSGLSWKELTQVHVGAQQNALLLASSTIPTPDAKVLAELLLQIKSRIRA